MKQKLTLLLSALALNMIPLSAELIHDITNQIPEIVSSKSDPEGQHFQKIPDVAQYGGADWSQVIGIARHITLAEAFEIANHNPDIAYFFHMKGYQMVLGGAEKETYRVFRQGDAVFFSGTPSWGSATGFADGYVKKSQE